jgi:hypothetical protein
VPHHPNDIPIVPEATSIEPQRQPRSMQRLIVTLPPRHAKTRLQTVSTRPPCPAPTLPPERS